MFVTKGKVLLPFWFLAVTIENEFLFMNVNSGFSLFPEINKIITLKISFTLLFASYEVLCVEDARI